MPKHVSDDEEIEIPEDLEDDEPIPVRRDTRIFHHKIDDEDKGKKDKKHHKDEEFDEDVFV